MWPCFYSAPHTPPLPPSHDICFDFFCCCSAPSTIFFLSRRFSAVCQFGSFNQQSTHICQSERSWDKPGIEWGAGEGGKCCNMYTTRRTLSTVLPTSSATQQLRQLICQMPNGNPKSIKSCFRLLLATLSPDAPPPLLSLTICQLPSGPSAKAVGPKLMEDREGTVAFSGLLWVHEKRISSEENCGCLFFCCFVFALVEAVTETETKLAVTSNFSYHSQSVCQSFTHSLSQSGSQSGSCLLGFCASLGMR